MHIYKYTTNREETRFFPELKNLSFESEWLTIREGFATIKKGYSWNGASPKIKIFGKIYGTWDGANDEAKIPTLWHDVFYQFAKDLIKLGVKRFNVDLRFKNDLIEHKFKYPKIYYRAVRSFGWITWNFRHRRNAVNKDTNFC